MSEDGGFRLVSVCRAHVYQQGSRVWGYFLIPVLVTEIRNYLSASFKSLKYRAGADIHTLRQKKKK